MTNILNFLPDDVSVNIPLDLRSGCKRCKLYKQELSTPYMMPHGNFKREILIWGEGISKIDDREGYQLSDDNGELLKECFDEIGLDLHEDCLKTNSLDCYISKNKSPTDTEIQCCYGRKENILSTYKPKVILLLGKYAIDSFYKNDPQRSNFKLSLDSLRGKMIPDKQLNAWICHSYPPSYILKNNEDKLKVFMSDLRTVKKCLKRKRPRNYYKEDFKYETVTSYKKLKRYLKDVIKQKLTVVHDYETSSYRYYEKIHEIYLVSFQTDGNGEHISENVVYCFPVQMTNDNYVPFWNQKQMGIIVKLWKTVLENNPLVVQNIQHEYYAGNYFFNPNNRKFKKQFVWDTMLGCRVADESKGVNSLKIQAYHSFGQEAYAMDKYYIAAEQNKRNKFDNIPFDKAVKYCCIDTYNTKRLWKSQLKKVKKKKLKRAYKLLHKSSLEFADMTKVGTRLDVHNLIKLTDDTTNKVASLKDRILSHKYAEKFKKQMGRPLRIKKGTSNDDLKYLLFNVLGAKPLKYSEKTKKPNLDAEMLQHYSSISSIINLELKFRKKSKLLSVLNNFNKHVVDGFIHPSFLLNTARTYRSSSKDPNFQNIPTRDPDLMVVRKLIIARKGYILAEVDYGSMEVRIIACWSKDEVLCKFVTEGFDFHADWTSRNLRIKSREFEKGVWKKLRFGVKNNFVFALFYGSYYANIAPDLWDYVISLDMRDILPTKFSTFKKHMKSMEQDFWEMFSGVKKAQEQAFKWYRKHGYIKQIGWGFRRHGYLSRNKIANTHIQGPAFQCLLWSVNHIGEIKHNYKSIFPGQVHDSLLIDIKLGEKRRLRNKVSDIMENQIREKNKWLIVPLETEWGFGPNWGELKEEK